jgi:hypothetical protein
VVASLQASGLPVTGIVAYTAENDPNKLLGRPGQYIGKVSWKDSRAGQSASEATVEWFGDDQSFNARFTYLDGIIKSSPLLLQYMYKNDARRAIARVPKELTPVQAGDYEVWLKKL